MPIQAKFLSEAEIRALPKPLIFTNGVFDLLHRGHVSYLEAAAALGASLVVAVNSDASARRLNKGPNRPLNAAADRMTVLAALQSVSAVIEFGEDTPVALLERIAPDVYVKGGDYDMSKLEETKVMAQLGGKALALNFVDGFSSTALIRKMQE
jgi:D-glycero-beta-D-manno-heptose 1-phosphate adenylyltransferase